MNTMIKGNSAHAAETLVDVCMNDYLICRCNGVTKGMILKAIQQGAANFADVSHITNASTDCGGCQSLVEELINTGGI